MQPTLTGYLTFLLAAEGRNSFTFRHAVNVSEIAVLLGQSLKMDQKYLHSLKIGSLLHDVGKLNVPNEILFKPAHLSDAEMAQIKQHPLRGHQIVGALDLTATERHIILFHHERWDGTGYPYGFSGKDIPLSARLVALADAIDAMLSGRPYRPAMSLKAVMAEIRDNAGGQFDPELATISATLSPQIVQLVKP